MLALVVILVIMLAGCSADTMSIKSQDDVEFYIMRVNDDYLEIPNECKFIYLDKAGTYPELENGQIAKVTADVDIYDGGEAGYSGNYFIKELKSSEVLQYSDVVKDAELPIATETDKMEYGKHMLQYQLHDDLYFIVLNRQYVDVYLDEESFLEYEWSGLDNVLSPFFDMINEDSTEQTNEVSESKDSKATESSGEVPMLKLPVSLDEQDTLDVSQFSDQTIVLPSSDIPQKAVYFEAFTPEIYDNFIIKNETELELYKQLFNSPLERSSLYSDDATVKMEYDTFMNEINSLTAQYPFDNYTYIATHLYVPYYRKMLGADIVIDHDLIGVIQRLEHLDDDGKYKPSLAPKDYYWIAAVPKNQLIENGYIGWDTPSNVDE